MKRLFPAFLLLISLTLPAQNWEILNSHDRYNYQASGAPLITNVIFADSFKVFGSDTLYYLNRIVQKPNYISSYDTVLRNLPQFFQKQVLRSPDGTYVFSIDSGYDGFNPDTFVIKTRANVGDNWLYDTTANITATVATQTLQILFGTTDSVKQINLSNGDSILLSKSFGIVGFPSDTLTATGKTPMYSNLQGIETRGIGDSVINFWNIYNFNVGDVFMYKLEDGIGCECHGYFKYTILSRQIFSDSVKYEMQEAFGESDNTGYTNDYDIQISLTFKDSINHFSNSFPKEFIYPLYATSDFSPQTGYAYSSFMVDSAYNVPCKVYNTVYDSLNQSMLLMGEYLWDDDYCEIALGIGDVHYSNFNPIGTWQQDLIGIEKNGVTTGTILTDEEITGITGPLNNTFAISLYPNLTADYTYVRLSNFATNPALHLAFYDLAGRIIVNQPITASRTPIDCRNLPSAVYIWRVCDEQQNVVGSGKLVKQ